MDIFERNQPRRLALAEAIKKAEIELELTDQFYRLQILKQQQKMLPNNQGYTMSDISWERAKQLGKEELAHTPSIASTKSLPNENDEDKFLKIVKNITSKGFVRSYYEEKLVDLSDVRINLKSKN